MSDTPLTFGKYTVLSRIGVGGMAEVFLCRQTGLGGFERLVVIKKVLAQYAGDAQFVQMLLDEARIAALLHHPNVVQILEVDAYSGQPYIAMEYVRGPTLRALIKRAQEKGRLHPGHMAKVLSDVCAGLNHAHNATDASGKLFCVVHRDLSPENILVSHDGAPKLVDFGVARARGRLATTNPGKQFGKLRYLAPEVLKGGPATPRSDIFSLGACLYEATTGKPAFDEDTDEKLKEAICERTPARPSTHVPGYPAELDRIVLWALEKDPDKRCPSAKDLRDALEALVRTGPCASSTDAVGVWINGMFPTDEAQPNQPPPAPVDAQTTLEVPDSAIEVLDPMPLGKKVSDGLKVAISTAIAFTGVLVTAVGMGLAIFFALRSPDAADPRERRETPQLAMVKRPVGEPPAPKVAEPEPKKPEEPAPKVAEPEPKKPEEPAPKVAEPEPKKPEAPAPKVAEPEPKKPEEPAPKVAEPAPKKEKKPKAKEKPAVAEPAKPAEPAPKAVEPEPVKPQEPAPKVAEPAPKPAEPEPAKAKPSGAGGKLAAEVQAKTADAVASALRAVEKALAGEGGATADVATGVTDPLYEELAKEVKAGKSVTVYPLATFRLVVQEASAGKDRKSIARKLMYAHKGGALAEAR